MLSFLILLSLLTGLSLMAVGPMLMAQRVEAIYLLLIFVTFMFPLRGVAGLTALRRKKGKFSLHALFLLIFEIVLMAALVALPLLSGDVFHAFLLIYLSLAVTIKAADSYLYFRNGQWAQFFPSLASAAAGAYLFFHLIFGSRAQKEEAVFLTVGILLLVLGTGQLCDFISLMSRNPRVRSVLSHIRLALPDLLGLLVPLRTAELLPEEPFVPGEQDRQGELEVIFHVSARGIALAGHCELCLDGKSLTYGAYDPKTARFLKTMGDGILFRAPRDEYLAWCITHEKKKIISYTLCLPPEQEALVRSRLARLLDDAEPWEPKLSPEDFASQVQALGDVEFYRIRRGFYRTYFIPTINCVSLTDHLLKKTDIGRANIPGINTPGAYLDLLERKFLAGEGLVTGRRVYGAAPGDIPALRE